MSFRISFSVFELRAELREKKRKRNWREKEGKRTGLDHLGCIIRGLGWHFVYKQTIRCSSFIAGEEFKFKAAISLSLFLSVCDCWINKTPDSFLFHADLVSFPTLCGNGRLRRDWLDFFFCVCVFPSLYSPFCFIPFRWPESVFFQKYSDGLASNYAALMSFFIGPLRHVIHQLRLFFLLCCLGLVSRTVNEWLVSQRLVRCWAGDSCSFPRSLRSSDNAFPEGFQDDERENRERERERQSQTAAGFFTTPEMTKVFVSELETTDQ